MYIRQTSGENSVGVRGIGGHVVSDGAYVDLTACGQSFSKLSFRFATSICENMVSGRSLPEWPSVEALSSAGIVTHKPRFLAEYLLNIRVASLNLAFASSVTFVPEWAAERNATSHS